MPRLSVLMPVRDAAPWLDASLRSLFRQSHADFEVVAVDDGSRDDSGDRLEAWSAREPRLRVIHTAARGLPLALQTALRAAASPIVARHDADDLSHRRRFELQLAHLAAHSEVAVVGSRVRAFPAAATGVGMRRWIAWHNALTSHEAMAAESLIDSPLAHGTAMMRREWLERVHGWRERGWAEDLDLWLRLLAAGARFAKLPDALYGWRQHRGSATRTDPRYATGRFTALKCEALRHGPLRAARAVRLVGTGKSLLRWKDALESEGFAVECRDSRAATPAVVAELRPPVVLVYVAREARARWRLSLARSDMKELRDFIFVA